MIYSQLYWREKKGIPTVLALLFITFVVSLFVYVFSGLSVPSRASKSPKEIKEYEITNLSANGEATIFWRTDLKESGWVILYDADKKPLGQIFGDERDTLEKRNLYLNHYVVLRQVLPTATFFKLGGGDTTKIAYQYDRFYELPKPKGYSTTNDLSPAYGVVIKPDGGPLEGAIVLLTVRDSYPLATITKSKGEWLIPLNGIYGRNDLKIVIPTEKQEVAIRVIDEAYPSSNITTFFTNLSSLPKVIIGSDYKFMEEKGQDVLSSSVNNEGQKKEIDIIFPQENAVVPGRNPLIKGIALPSSQVTIVIESPKSYSSIVTADNDGSWKYVLPEGLTPGSHKITITTYDRQGKEIRLERRFAIAKSGEQVLSESTPSSTITPIAPTSTLPPTSIPTVVPSQPVSGSNFNVFMMGSTSLIIIGFGILLAF